MHTDLTDKWDDLQRRIAAAKASGDRGLLDKLDDELDGLKEDFAFVRSVSE
jgi:hypothetical protein